MPDDDLAIAPAQVDRLFAEMRRHDLVLAQPAMTADSYWSWTVALRNPATQLRHVLPDFCACIICAGFDWVWQLKAGFERRKVAVLDTAAVTHTRPYGGPIYRFMKDRPFEVKDEIADILRSRGIDRASTFVLGIRLRGGLELRGGGAVGRAVLRAGYCLAIAEAYLRRAPYRWDLHKRLRQSFAAPEAPLERLPPNDGSRFAAALARGDLAGS